ncbi:MAG: response regulator, partial [Vicinamibacterales bacterium]
MKLPYQILVLDDDENALSGLVEMLRDADYLVTGALTYDAAKRLLAVHSYDLLVTDVRLRGFNGLNLVKSCRAEYPEMAVIIISGYEEPLMELEASRYQALFVQKPIRPFEFLATVSSLLASVRRERRWPRKRVVGGFRVTAAGRPAAVVDVGYGGLRLEVPKGTELPSSFAIELSGIGLQLEVEPVWSCPSDNSNCTMYGAALASDGTTAVD